jgi:hypothetical protein
VKRPSQAKFDFFLVGPISLPEFNGRFHAIARSLRNQGFTVASPVEAFPDVIDTLAAMIRTSLPLLAASTRVVLLGDHRNCPAGMLLVYLAQRLEMEFLNAASMEAMPQMRLQIQLRNPSGDQRRAHKLLKQLSLESESFE